MYFGTVPNDETIVIVSDVCLEMFAVDRVVHDDLIPVEHISVGNGATSGIAHRYTMFLFVYGTLKSEEIVLEDVLGELGEDG